MTLMIVGTLDRIKASYYKIIVTIFEKNFRWMYHFDMYILTMTVNDCCINICFLYSEFYKLKCKHVPSIIPNQLKSFAHAIQFLSATIASPSI